MGYVYPHKPTIVFGIVGPRKRWCNLPLSKNRKPLRQNLHIKKGDSVVVIAGDDRGTVGQVLMVYPKTRRVRVKDVNIVTKHNKPMREGEKGSLLKSEGVINHSNVMRR